MSNFFSRTKDEMKYLFVKKSKLNRKNQKKKNRAIATVIGLALVLVELIVMILFLFQIFKLDMLPMKYLIALNSILVLILLYNFASQFTKAHIFGKVLSILLSGVMIFGFLFSSKVNSTLNKISENTTKRVDTVNIVVLKSDSAASVKDTTSYTYGYNSTLNNDVLVKAIDDINADYSSTIETKSYTNWDELLNALYENKDIKCMAVLSSVYTSLSEQYEDFSDKTKIVGSVSITSEVKLSTAEQKVNGESFVMLLSGNDSENGVDNCTGVTTSGRSDVNILAICNPTTKQILLVSTPRDSYVTISDASGRTGLDKLTHASNAGIEYSIDALKRIYGVTADYYVRINFTGCVDIVNALGGITINSEVEFTNGWEAWYNSYHYTIGPNECNGDQTIAFVRERKTFSNGDLQRGKNQEAALKGIIAKATSPAILTNYDAVLDSVSDVLLTNLPTSMISALVKGQLSDSTPWTVQSYSISGTSGSRDGQVYGLSAMSVVFPDTNDINCAIQMISKVQNGDVFDVDEYVEEYKASLNPTTSGTSSSGSTTTTTSTNY